MDFPRFSLSKFYICLLRDACKNLSFAKNDSDKKKHRKIKKVPRASDLAHINISIIILVSTPAVAKLSICCYQAVVKLLSIGYQALFKLSPLTTELKLPTNVSIFIGQFFESFK